MTNPMHLRFAALALLFTALGGGYVGLHGHSQGLLTPIPASAVAIPMLVSMLLALGVAVAVAGGIANRLLRRLVVIGTMAITIYLAGEDFRGLWAWKAFSGAHTTTTERWMTLGLAQGSTITAMSPARRKTLAFAAMPDAVAAAGPGRCVSVRIERTADGLERIAPDQKPLSAADVGGC